MLRPFLAAALVPSILATSGTTSFGGVSRSLSVEDDSDDNGCYRAILARDDFERGLDERWDCAELAQHPVFGLFGTNPIDPEALPPSTVEEFLNAGGGCDLSRTFEVPVVSEDVRLEFLSYAWCTCGDMAIRICNTTIDIDRNMHRGSPGGSRNGIVWTRHNITNYTAANMHEKGTPVLTNFNASDPTQVVVEPDNVGEHPDRVQLIEVSIPPRCYEGTGELPVEFVFRNIGGEINHIGGIDNLKMTAEICSPTPVPRYKTETPTAAFTPMNACVENHGQEIATDGEECNDIITKGDLLVGSMCLLAVRNSTAVRARFEMFGDWRIQTQRMWVGDDLSRSPVTIFGQPDSAEFPYFWHDPRGNAIVDEYISLRCYDLEGMRSYYQQGVAYLQVVKVDPGHGLPIPESAIDAYVTKSARKPLSVDDGWHGWFDFVINCHCTGFPSDIPSRAPSTIPSLSPSGHLSLQPSETKEFQEACIYGENGSLKECHEILTSGGLHMGTTCLEVPWDASDIQITFSALGNRRIYSVAMWAGENADTAPKAIDGSLDTGSFPYSWNDLQGVGTIIQYIPLRCSNENRTAIYSGEVVTHITLSDVRLDGTEIEGSEVEAFALEYSSLRKVNGEEFRDYWFDFSVKCNCREPFPVASASPSSGETSSLPITSPPGQTFPTSTLTSMPSSKPLGMGSPSATSLSPSSEFDFGICIEGDGGTNKECHGIITEKGELVGFMCAEVTADSSAIKFVFTALGTWKIKLVHLWVGCNCNDAPREGDGSLKSSTFPHFWSDLAGQVVVTQYLDTRCVSGTRKYAEEGIGEVLLQDNENDLEVIAYVQELGKEKKLGDEYGWFDFEVNCMCAAASEQPLQAPGMLAPSGLPTVFSTNGPSRSLTGAPSGSLTNALTGSPSGSLGTLSPTTKDINLINGHPIASPVTGSPNTTFAVTFSSSPTTVPTGLSTSYPSSSPTSSLVTGAPSSSTEGSIESPNTLSPTTETPSVASGHPSASLVTGYPITSSTAGPATLSTDSPTVALTSSPTRIPSENPIKIPTVSPVALVTSSAPTSSAPTSSPFKIPNGSPGSFKPAATSPTLVSGHASISPNAGTSTDASSLIPSIASSTNLTNVSTTEAPVSAPGTGLPTLSLKQACIVGDDASQKECNPIVTETGITAGTFCLQIDRNSANIKAEFSTYGNWRIQTQYLWIGSDVESAPQKMNGALDFIVFPYYGNDVAGSKFVTSFLALRCNAMTAAYSEVGIALLGMLQVDFAGSFVPNSETVAFAQEYTAQSSDNDTFGWFDFNIRCDCSEKQVSNTLVPRTVPPSSGTNLPTASPVYKPLPTRPQPTNSPHDSSSICFRDTAGDIMQCVFIFASSGEKLGRACFEFLSDPVRVSILFTSFPGWVFLEHRMWVGNDVTTVPVGQGGTPDHLKFAYLWQNATGESEWRAYIGPRCHRTVSGFYLQHVMSRITMSRQNSDGTLFGRTIIAEFGESYKHFSGESSWYGYLKYSVDCHCTTQSFSSEPSLPPLGPTMCLRAPVRVERSCHHLVSLSNQVLGNVCISLQNDDQSHFLLEFAADPGWTFLHHDAWVGPSVNFAPNRGDILDYDSFPIYWCDSGGQAVWSVAAEARCHDASDTKQSVVVIVRSEAAQTLPNSDTPIPNTNTTGFSWGPADRGLAGRSWFQVDIDCNCSFVGPTLPSYAPSAEPISEANCSLTMSAEGEKIQEKTCWELTTQRGAQVGEICLDLHGNDIDVSLEATSYWSFISHHLWTGRYASEMPRSHNGDINLSNFPYYYCNSTGEQHWMIQMQTGCSKHNPEDMLLSIISLSRAAQVDPSTGDVIVGSEEIVFIEAHGTSGNQSSVGWLDLEVECFCNSTAINTTTPTQQTTHSTQAPSSPVGTSPPHIQDKACLETGTNNSEECHPILSSQDKSKVGTICAEIIDQSTTLQLLRLTFTTTAGWAFTRNNMWIDSDIRSLPKRVDGGPDVHKFPYFSKKTNTGIDTWEALVTLKCHQYPSSTYTLTAVAQSIVILTAGNPSSNASEVLAYAAEREGSRGVEFSWMDFQINCNCKRTLTNLPTLVPTTVGSQSQCPGGDYHPQGLCRTLITERGEKAGYICVDQGEDSDSADIIFKADKHWALTSQEMWIGYDLASVPTAEDGTPAFETFPYLWQDIIGTNEWSANVAVRCEEEGSHKIYVVSRSTLSQANGDGMLFENTKEVAFPMSHSDVTKRDWLHFNINCDSGKAKLVDPIARANSFCDAPNFSMDFRDSSQCGTRTIPFAGECDTKSSGDLSLVIVGNDSNAHHLEVSFKTSPGQTFTRTELWLGPDLIHLPKAKDGTPNLDLFPHFSFEDKEAYIFKAPLKLDCSRESELFFVGVAHATTIQYDLESDSEVEVSQYAYEYDGVSNSSWYGYFDFSILCICSDYKKLPEA